MKQVLTITILALVCGPMALRVGVRMVEDANKVFATQSEAFAPITECVSYKKDATTGQFVETTYPCN